MLIPSSAIKIFNEFSRFQSQLQHLVLLLCAFRDGQVTFLWKLQCLLYICCWNTGRMFCLRRSFFSFVQSLCPVPRCQRWLRTMIWKLQWNCLQMRRKSGVKHCSWAQQYRPVIILPDIHDRRNLSAGQTMVIFHLVYVGFIEGSKEIQGGHADVM